MSIFFFFSKQLSPIQPCPFELSVIQVNFGIVQYLSVHVIFDVAERIEAHPRFIQAGRVFKQQGVCKQVIYAQVEDSQIFTFNKLGTGVSSATADINWNSVATTYTP